MSAVAPRPTPKEPAPIYLSDLYVLKLFAIKMLDNGQSITHKALLDFLVDGQLWTHMNIKSKNIMQLVDASVPNDAQARIVDLMKDTLIGNIGDAGKFWLRDDGNGYAMLLALVFELEKNELSDFHRP